MAIISMVQVSLDLSDSPKSYRASQNLKKKTSKKSIWIQPDEANDSFTLVAILKPLESSHSRHLRREIRKPI